MLRCSEMERRFGRTRVRSLSILACLVVSTLTSGCGTGDVLTRVPVEGTVRYQGQPVADGQIRFIPQGDSRGPLTVEPIVDGRYRCEYKGGVPAGTHRVEIYSWDPKVPASKGPGAPPRPQFLPPKYNDRSELVWTLDAQRGPLTKDFDLP